MIEVKNLQKAFGGNMVLKGVTETIEKGEKKVGGQAVLGRQ